MNAILTAILVLFLISAVITALNLWKVRPGIPWFLAIGAAFIGWLLIFLARGSNPHSFVLVNWESSSLFSVSPTLIVDDISWPFAVAILSLLLAVLLTDVARGPEIDPTAWATGLAMTAAGLIAVLAANPLTLLLGWAIIDIAETATLLRKVAGSEQRERVVVSFSVRVVGMLLVISAILRAVTLGSALDFQQIFPEVAGYLLLAAGLRLGVIPPHQPFLQEPPLRRGLGTLVRLIPVAASLVLVARVASVGTPPNWELPILIVAVVAVSSGGFNWIRSRDELDGRPSWILGIAGFAVVAAVRNQPAASLAWGLGLLFSGGVLFLFSTRHRRLLGLPVVGLATFSALPFSPVWRGLSMYTGKNIILGIFLFLAHALLLLGYLRHALRFGEDQNEIERWVWIVYPLGLAILPTVQFGVAWVLWGASFPEMGAVFIPWWGGVLVLGMAAFIYYVSQKTTLVPEGLTSTARGVFSLGWVYRSFWWFYRFLSKFVSNFTLILEGEGGVLWAVLILIMLVTAFAQIRGGG